MGFEVVSTAAVQESQGLIDFIGQCPSPFHTVKTLEQRLQNAGFSFLPESNVWNIERGGNYYTVRNGTSLIAFHVGSDVDALKYTILAAHTDSPTFKVKSRSEVKGTDGYLKVNVEPYGGMIDRTWLDRPLSVAGRVLVGVDGRIESRLISPDQNVLMFPSVAIHLNRDVNTKGALDRAVDMVPLFSAGALDSGSFDSYVAEVANTTPEHCISYDLCLVNRQPSCIWGAAQEFVSAPRLDDLQCVYGAVRGFVGPCNEKSISVLACFDNEEVGSATYQGALSPFLANTLSRVARLLSYTDEQYQSSIPRSFLVSADNAQAVHPNHTELYDAQNRCVLNGGVVIKENASQRYATDGYGRAVFTEICRRAGVPLQTYANRSDLPGGTTIGNLISRTLGIHTIDIGLPQLAMHSAYETAGVCDSTAMIEATRALFTTDLHIEGNECVLEAC